MKAKSALTISRKSIPVHAIFVVVFGSLFWFWSNWLTLLLLALCLFSLLGDLIYIAYIRSKAKRDPGFLESKVECAE